MICRRQSKDSNRESKKSEDKYKCIQKNRLSAGILRLNMTFRSINEREIIFGLKWVAKVGESFGITNGSYRAICKNFSSNALSENSLQGILIAR